MTSDPDLDMIMAEMRSEIILDCRDKLAEIYGLVDDMELGRGRFDYHLLDLQRIVHSIKGTGGTFDFPTVSHIAHSLEDFIETASELKPADLRGFLDTMSDILDAGANPAEDEAAAVLDSLPTHTHRPNGEQIADKGTALLVMPKSVQRKIIGQELTSFGFRVAIAANGLEAIDTALTLRPRLVVATQILGRMSGTDLAGALGAIQSTAAARFAVVTASDEDDLPPVPANAAVIRKGPHFARDFMVFLKGVEVG